MRLWGWLLSVCMVCVAAARSLDAQAGPDLEGVSQVVSGLNYSCALVKGGVYCWGEGSQGQLGHGAWDDASTPVRVRGIEDATALAAGFTHTCALRATGQVWCWGGGHLEGLGDGSQLARTQPVAVPGLDDAVALDATFGSTCALRRDRSVVCWGRNLARRPHGPEPEALDSPQPVPGMMDVHLLLVGGLHVCAVQGPSRELVCVGLDHGFGDQGRYEDPVVLQSSGLTGVQEAFTGPGGICEKRADTWTCWGQSRLSEWLHPLGLWAGHRCVTNSEGHVWCWGENTSGQLGDATHQNSAIPVQVVAPASKTLVEIQTPTAYAGLPFTADQIAAGYNETCALKRGEVWCWGDWHGFLPIHDPFRIRHTPKAVGITDAVEVAAGFGFMCARRASGSVWCWGENDRGQLGDATRTNSLKPVAVVGLEDAKALALGYGQGCAIRHSGEVMCWGAFDPPIWLADLKRFKGDLAQLVQSGSNACALLKSGEVLCAGHNNHGQLGDGFGGCVEDPLDTFCRGPHARCRPKEICAKSDTFVAVVGLKDATTLALGGDFACALRAKGKVSCWGNPSQGRLGIGAPTGKTWTPQEISGLVAKSLAAYNSHACAITDKDHLLCWGQNVWGELGNHSKQSQNTPAAVFSFQDALEVSPGMSHTCARRKDASVWCWGNNDQGLLGVGLNENISRLTTPHPVLAPPP